MRKREGGEGKQRERPGVLTREMLGKQAQQVFGELPMPGPSSLDDLIQGSLPSSMQRAGRRGSEGRGRAVSEMQQNKLRDTSGRKG